MAWDIGEWQAWIGGLSPQWQNSMAIKNIAHPLNSYRYNPDLGLILINDTSFGSEHAARGAHFVLADGSAALTLRKILSSTSCELWQPRRRLRPAGRRRLLSGRRLLTGKASRSGRRVWSGDHEDAHLVLDAPTRLFNSRL